MINKLFVLPTPATVAKLQEVFQAASFTIEWDSLGCEIGSTEDVINTNDQGLYRALTGPINVWYESKTAKSWLILPLIPSPEMAERNAEVGDHWGRDFSPFVVLGPDPLLTRNRRSFINSVSSRFVDFPMLLNFHAETVVSSDDPEPSQADYHNDYAMTNGASLSPLFFLNNQ